MEYLDFALATIGKDDDDVAVLIHRGDQTGLVAVLIISKGDGNSIGRKIKQRGNENDSGRVRNALSNSDTTRH